MKNKPGKLFKTIGSTLLAFSIMLTVLVPQNVYAEELPTPGAQGFKYLYTLMHHGIQILEALCTRRGQFLSIHVLGNQNGQHDRECQQG